jgi:hypothetical protein
MSALIFLQLSSAEETLHWQQIVKQAQEEDHAEVMEGIAAVLKTDLGTAEQVRELRDQYATDREIDKARWQGLSDLLQKVCFGRYLPEYWWSIASISRLFKRRRNLRKQRI